MHSIDKTHHIQQQQQHLHQHQSLSLSLSLSSVSTTTIEHDDNGPETPKAPRGKRSDITEKDLEEFVRSFSMAGDFE
jgi:hypothetical protein